MSSTRAPRSSRARIVIAGPGRAGSTLLVQILDGLGLETHSDALTYWPEARAGLEVDILDPDAPYVVKDPVLSVRLPRLLERGAISRADIAHAIIPIRDLEAAAMSRLVRSVEEGRFHPPGGLWRARTLAAQRRFLAVATYGFMLALAEHDIPAIVIAYPRFARDPNYAYRRLGPVIGAVPEADFLAAWKRAVDRSLVRDDDTLHVNRTRRALWEVRARVERAGRGLRKLGRKIRG